jgi:hypothetical protein
VRKARNGLGAPPVGRSQWKEARTKQLADADAAHVIVDLLVRLQGQEPSPLDPAFAERDEVAALASALDIAARTRLASPSEPASASAAADLVHSLHDGG